MSAVIAQVCGFCGATPDEPCRSVGKRPITEPHMQRMGPRASDDEARALRAEYATAVVERYFGYVTPELLERARKDRSIDHRKPWVRRALESARVPR